MKKRFSSSFDPPRIVRGKSGWYILWYWTDPKTGEKVRERPRFNLNRIKDIRDRERRAQALCVQVLAWLEAGRPGDEFDEHRAPGRAEPKAEPARPAKHDTPITDALQLISKIKENTPRSDTARSWRSSIKLFTEFLALNSADELPVGDITAEHAAEYLDYCSAVRGHNARSWNNQLSRMRTVFKELATRRYIDQNPFEDFAYKKPPPKLRRPFRDHEARVVARRLAERRRLLFYALILQYTCYLRPIEIRRLRFEDLDLSTFTVHVKADKEKNWRAKTCLIPESYRYLFCEDFWGKYPREYFIYGKNFEPHPEKQCGERTMNNIHARILQELKEEGELSDITGLSWYSWKDTGITAAFYEVDPGSIQDQANHANMAMTMRYRAKRDAPQGMSTFKGALGDDLL